MGKLSNLLSSCKTKTRYEELMVKPGQGAISGELEELPRLLVASDMVGDTLGTALKAGELPEVSADSLIKAYRIFRNLRASSMKRLVITVSGPSGAGKSELAALLGSYFTQNGKQTYVISGDCYARLAPRDNERHRAQLFEQGGEEALRNYLGTQSEIHFERLNGIIEAFHDGSAELDLRLMNNPENRLENDHFCLKLASIQVLIIEGTWTALCSEADYRVFIEADPELTRKRREERGREKVNDFTQLVLAVEQERLQKVSELADFVAHIDGSIEVCMEKYSLSSGEVEEKTSVLQRQSIPNLRQVPVEAADALGKDQALSLLRKVATPWGFLASSSDTLNYQRVWARDSVITGLAGCLSGDTELIETLGASLRTLASHLGPNGEIPSNVKLSREGKLEEVSYGTLAARLDVPSWFVIGAGHYAAAHKSPAVIKEFAPLVSQALQFLKCAELNNRGLVHAPIGGDWADEYLYHSYIFLPQVLRLWALQIDAEIFEHKESWLVAKELRESLLVNYWPSLEHKHSKLVYHPTAYQRRLEEGRETNSFEPALSPAGYPTWQFDFLGNSIAVLLKLGSVEQLERVISSGEAIVAELPTRLAPAFWPPVFPGDPRWAILQGIRTAHFRERPYHYHNGGGWQMVSGFWGAALNSLGRKEAAQAHLTAINAANALGTEGKDWEFFEYLESYNGKPAGTNYQAWSAAAALSLAEILNGRELIGVGGS